MVFHQRLHNALKRRFEVSHLSYALKIKYQYQLTVKVQRVFPSCCG
ncbi:hypothetical protein VDG1235_1186 [Verrucomicrobiia bacterium DG1235]|nr:hypothetical protein VDG1235_1186 [Verrucomicrobiae bacterium DG1235]